MQINRLRDSGWELVTIHLQSRLKQQLSTLNRIISARMKRMTSQYPAKREEKSIHHSVSGNGINGILGTGGHKSTGRRKQGGEKQLIDLYQKDTDPSHYVITPLLKRKQN